MTTDTPAMDEKGLTQQFIERLAKEAGGEEYGPRTWNMTFKRDALHRFADSIAKFCESTYLAATARDGEIVTPADAVHRDGCEHTTSPIWLCDCPRPRLRASLKAVPEVEVVKLPTPPESWELEAAAIFMDHVDDDETGSVHRVAAFLRAVACLAIPQPAPDTEGR